MMMPQKKHKVDVDEVEEKEEEEEAPKSVFLALLGKSVTVFPQS
jgi:hypothetical protein